MGCPSDEALHRIASRRVHEDGITPLILGQDQLSSAGRAGAPNLSPLCRGSANSYWEWPRFPIFAFSGLEDNEITQGEIEVWSRHTVGSSGFTCCPATIFSSTRRVQVSCGW